MGGCLAGLVASRLPDLFDPPVSPNHRDVAHAVAPVGAVLVAAWGLLKEGQERLRAYADTLAAERERSNSMTDLQRRSNRLLEWLCRALAGALAGATAGYLSHLALDGLTPSGLPVFANGI